MMSFCLRGIFLNGSPDFPVHAYPLNRRVCLCGFGTSGSNGNSISCFLYSILLRRSIPGQDFLLRHQRNPSLHSCAECGMLPNEHPDGVVTTSNIIPPHPYWSTRGCHNRGRYSPEYSGSFQTIHGSRDIPDDRISCTVSPYVYPTNRRLHLLERAVRITAATCPVIIRPLSQQFPSLNHSTQNYTLDAFLVRHADIYKRLSSLPRHI